jgi:anti-sigma factor RsiW
MNRLPEIELMRLLHGELPPERAFELHERLAREPELAEELRRLEATWDRLELPPAAPAPRGFARQVVGRAESGGLWSAAPTRVRAAGFALLAAGLALGVGIASALARLDAGTQASAGTALASSPAVPAASTPGSSSPTVTAGEPGASSKGPRPPVAPTVPETPAVPTPSTPETPASDRVAELDYDLPAEDGAYADEGTLADDFWQAFDGSDNGAATDPDTGSGSEGL